MKSLNGSRAGGLLCLASRRAPAAACALSLLLLPLARPAAARQQQAGYVLELAGNWYLAGTPPRRLSPDDPLPAGAVVSAESPRPGDYIVILDNGGDIFARRRCGRDDDCRQPVRLGTTRRSSRPGKLQTLVRSVMTLLLGEHDVYVPLRSRGVGRGLLREAVVSLQGGRLDLAPAFAQTPARDDQVRLREASAPAGTPAGAWLGPFRLAAGAGGGAALPRVPGLRPGLYELVLLNSAGGVVVGDAWVLVTAAPAHAGAAAAHAEARALAESWGEQVTPEGARSFLRAHLAHLAGRRKAGPR